MCFGNEDNICLYFVLCLECDDDQANVSETGLSTSALKEKKGIYLGFRI